MSSHKEKIIPYSTLRSIATKECGERLVDLRLFCPAIEFAYRNTDMLSFTGDGMLARKEVGIRLNQASHSLHMKSPGAKLKVVYAYRHPEIQEKYFAQTLDRLRSQSSFTDEQQLFEAAHMFIAVPSVAGHPTGGAVDLTLTRDGSEYDMGGEIYDFSDDNKIRTFTSKISRQQRENRLLLREVMLEQRFAPFDGEWWHFCFGDKEWAAYYDEPHALYAPVLLPLAEL
jgi:D-alanyl-D-alanine dipeptidase